MYRLKAAVIFENFGPYHLARLDAVAPLVDLLAVEIAAKSDCYAWTKRTETAGGTHPGASSGKLVTLLEEPLAPELRHSMIAERLKRTLNEFNPQIVFVPGWSGKAAFVALEWCIQRKVPAVAMSESTEWDERRVWWKENVKRHVVGACSAALVGGRAHADYMARLGMLPESIFLGYDSVDNDYFTAKSEEVRRRGPEARRQCGLPKRYFLASARFVKKKNLPGLMEAFALYRKRLDPAFSKPASCMGAPAWNLVLLGDGELRGDLDRMVAALKLQDAVMMPGFKQYPDLPVYYGLAGAFVHASTTEQWGLVVNEAMASGLPVIVSRRCGCAGELIREGQNGFTFDPYNIEDLAELMFKVSSPDFPLSDFGQESRRIVQEVGPARFAQGFTSAANFAYKAGSKVTGVWTSLLLRGLAHRTTQ